MGTVFRAHISLDHSKKTNKDGSEKKSGAKEYVFDEVLWTHSFYS